MPDFRLQNNFPIATVIDAAGRNAALQEQAREAGNKSLIEGLQSIGQVGQSLYDTKKRVANAMVIKQALFPDMDPNIARNADPDTLLGIAKVQKGTIDLQTLLNSFRPPVPADKTTPSPGSTPIPATPAPIQPGASLPSPKPEAILASASQDIPMPAHTEPAAMRPFGGASTATVPSQASMPVPIAAPPTKPKTINQATFNAGLRMGIIPQPDVPVMSNAEGLAKGSAPKGTHFINTGNSTDQVSWDTATPQQQSLARAMYEGRVRPSDIGFRDRGKVTLLANEYANVNGLPPFKSYNADVNATMAKYATSGKLGQNALSLNTALGHAASAYDSYEAIGNTNQKWLNTPINVLRKQTNDPNVVALGINLNALQGELANVFKNSGATDQEISHWQKYLNEDLTPSQFNGALSKIDDLLKSRLSAMEYQRGQAGGGNGNPLISPHAKAISDKLGKGGGNATVTPNGTKYTVNP